VGRNVVPDQQIILIQEHVLLVKIPVTV